MHRIASMLITFCPCMLSAHPCPFDWNINFAQKTDISGTSLSNFVEKFNEAAKKETKGGIARAIIYDEKPDTLRKIPGNTPFSNEMDGLFRRYVEVMDFLKKKGLGDSGPISLSFPAKIPVACVLSTQFSNGYTDYEEVKEGARISRLREVLECRSYHVSGKLIETASKWQNENRIPAGMQPVPYIFASFSGMTWAFDTFSDEANDYVQESFLDGVALYIPEKKVVLAIETKDKHEDITKVLTERGLLDNHHKPETKEDAEPQN